MDVDQRTVLGNEPTCRECGLPIRAIFASPNHDGIGFDRELFSRQCKDERARNGPAWACQNARRSFNDHIERS